ncbi:MAG: prolyl oligopeptidase family serine peptidase [Gemmataceae bacterium]
MFARAALVLLFAAGLAPADPPKKRITHADYEIWNTATGVTLSPDGKFIAYVVRPMDGEADGTVVVRNLASGSEYRFPTGTRAAAAASPTPPAPDEGDDQPPPKKAEPEPATTGAGGPSGSPAFSPDSRTVFFPLLPTKAEQEKAKADKKKPDEQPKGVLAVVELASGKVTARLEKVRSFEVVGAGTGFLLYTKEPKPEDKPKADSTEPEQAPMPTGPGGAGRKGGRQGGGVGPFGFGGGKGGAVAARPQSGAELVVRNLANGTEHTFTDVTEHRVTKDHKQLVYAVSGKAAEKNGVYVAPLGQGDAAAIKSGAGRYHRLTWDENQTKLAFFVTEQPAPPAKTGEAAKDGKKSEPAPKATTPPKLWVYVWDRREPKVIASTPTAAAVSPVAFVRRGLTVAPAVEVYGPETPGLKPGTVVVDRGGLSFTTDGLKLLLATGPNRAEEPKAEPAPAPAAVAGAAGRAAGRTVDDRVELDLWHWKDEYVQPMQKVRAPIERNRSFRAVLFLDTKQFRQLADADTDVTVPGHGDWAVASSDKRFRSQNWLSPIPRDYALLNVRTGDGKPLLREQSSGVTMTPKGKHAVWFDGKHWHAQAVPDGKAVNLTAKLGVAFHNEEADTPTVKPPYGPAAWTTDDKVVLLSDRYDLWKVNLDGSGAENLTKTGRTLKTRFRPIRLAEPEEGEEKGFDLSKPLLLTAENLETRDTGFFRLTPGGKPSMLVMGARRYGSPTKAKRADTLLFTVSTFADYPDYYTADRDFREVKRVTDINPKVRDFNWGTAELVQYRTADGLPLSGMLIKPEDFDPSKKYPMIVYIYERLSQGVHNFTLPRQGTSINPTYYASNGYLVFMPDIAYTTGSPGQNALKCVLPAIQAVVDKGFVKEDAIGIQGHSWGGYQIAYMVTQTNRFKAAAAGAPVSNMVSAYSGIRWGSGMPRQMQYEHGQSRIGGSLWQSPLRYIENSPVFMADRVTTPLLMLHNDQDDAVPWYQGIEYYLALRRLGKEVYLLNYNGEPHGLRKKANQRDYTVRMQQFFDHHLKGGPAPEWMAKGVPYTERDKEKEQWKKLFEPAKK